MNIYNPVCYIPKEAYGLELEKYVEHVKKTPGLLALYTLGSPNVPGLSDLDVVCIVSDDIRPEDAVRLNINSKKFNPQIFLHGPLIFPESLSRHIPTLLYTINFTHLWSPSGAPQPDFYLYPPREAVSLAHALDQAEQKLNLFEYDQKRGATDKRRRLRALNFLLHTETIFKLLKIEVGPVLRKGAEQLRALRDRWKQGAICSDEEFLNLYHLSDDAAREVFLNSLQYFYARIGAPQINTKEIHYQVASKKVSCSAAIDVPQAERHYVQIGRYKRLYMSTRAPLTYAAYLECYNDFNSGVLRPEASDFLNDFIARRKNIQLHNQFLDAKNILFAPRSYTGLPTRLSKRWDVRTFDQLYWFFERLIVK